MGGQGPQSDQLSAPRPLLGLRLDCCVWSSFPSSQDSSPFRVVPARVGLPAHCQAGGTASDGLQPTAYYRGWTHIVRVGRMHSVRRVCMLVLCDQDLPPPGRRQAWLEGVDLLKLELYPAQPSFRIEGEIVSQTNRS